MSYPFTIGGLLALVVCTINYFAIEPFILCGILVSVAFVVETAIALSKWINKPLDELEQTLSQLH